MQKIKNLLLYGGLKKEEYEKIIPAIAEDNRNHLLYLSLEGFIPFAIIGINFLSEGREKLGMVYIIMAIILLLFLLITISPAKKSAKAITTSTVIFDFVLAFVGIVAARANLDEKATLYLPMIIIAAVIYCLRPIVMISIVSVAEILFLLTVYNSNFPEMAHMNAVNSLVFSFVAIFTGVHMMRRTHVNFYTDYRNNFLASCDQLTGALNRRSYEDSLKAIVDEKKEVIVVMCDVNELKVANDVYGHQAGDELIKGAVEIISNTFGRFGNVYRIGGDEFAAIMDKPVDDLDKLISEFDEVVKSWRGAILDHISISIGVEEVKDVTKQGLYKAIKNADEKMYMNKEQFYNKKGVDRRGQASAHTALCNLYTKILKINLTDDSFVIVNMDSNEQTSSMGYSNQISTWLSEFGKSGQVHKDDLENYLKYTDVNYLSEYFKQDKNSISIHYRRNYNGVYKQVVMEMIPADDYSEDNQSLFLYVKDIDK